MACVGQSTYLTVTLASLQRISYGELGGREPARDVAHCPYCFAYVLVLLMWLTVQVVLYLTESRMPSKVFVMGKNSISGVYVILHQAKGYDDTCESRAVNDRRLGTTHPLGHLISHEPLIIPRRYLPGLSGTNLSRMCSLNGG
jgi:hypothetical protein